MYSKLYLFIFLFSITELSGYAQAVSRNQLNVSSSIYGTPKDYPAKFKRKLVVQLMEEDPEMARIFGRDAKNNSDGLTDYRNYIDAYNAAIKNVVPKYWKLNTDIDFKTPSEVKALIKSKNAKQYMILYIYNYGFSKEFNCLCYIGAEEHIPTPDYKIFLPLMKYKEHPAYSEGEIIFAVKAMQNNIKEIVDSNKKIEYGDFIKVEAKKNCEQLKTKKLLVDKSLVDKKFKTLFMEHDVTLATDNYEMVDHDAIDNSLKNETDEFVTLFIPYNKGAGGDQVVCYKLVVSSKTGEVIAYSNSVRIMGNFPSNLQKADFKDFAKCK